MKKTKTIEYTVCDFEHDVETDAVGMVMPSEQHVCAMHMKAYTEEIRLPNKLGGEMSGHKIAVTPGYDAKMKIVFKKEK